MNKSVQTGVRPVRKRSIILRLGIFVFALFMVVSNAKLQVELIQKLDLKKARMEQNEKAALKVEELQNLLENGTESDFIERVARERLGYVYSDEEVYTDISGK